MIYSTEIHGVDNKATEYLTGWQRARAELDNFRKRMASEQMAQQGRLKREIIHSLLPLRDNFKSVAEHVPADLKDNNWTQGVLHVVRQLESILKEYGVTVIEDLGGKFDPNVHEAVAEEDSSEVKAGEIVEVVQAGYKIGDEVVRPAKVKVAK